MEQVVTARANDGETQLIEIKRKKRRGCRLLSLKN